MRLIDADSLEKLLITAITIQEAAIQALGMQNDEFAKGELKAYKDVLKEVKEMENELLGVMKDLRIYAQQTKDE